MNQELIMAEHIGYHNKDVKATINRLEKSKSYKDLSTICIIPTLGCVHPKVVQSWMGLLTPMNQQFFRIFATGYEVGNAYSSTIEQILLHPQLSKFKYILTLEHDNMPPADGLLKMYEYMDEFDAIGGLYFTKGEFGQPMCYGKPGTFPANFIPFMPVEETVEQCRGLGMGFTLFKMDMFKDPQMKKPFFETVQKMVPGQGAMQYTQDLKFFEEAGKLGYTFACDSRIRVGHYDATNDFIW